MTPLLRLPLIPTALIVIASNALAAGQARSFDVTSVKESASDSRTALNVTPGRFTATRVTLRDLIKLAYSLEDRIKNDDQVVGGPDWVTSDHFDVVATGAPRTVEVRPGGAAPPESTALNDLRSMLQTLLADRFRLVIHHESRDVPVYALTRVSNGRLGSELRVSTADCTKEPASADTNAAPCGGFRFLGPTLAAHAVTIPMLVSFLSNLPAVGRIVIDRTGLGGRFDLALTWTREAPGPTQPAPTDQAIPDAASIFTAVQEQLGLKLEPTRGPVAVVVIDSAERPSPN